MKKWILAVALLFTAAPARASDEYYFTLSSTNPTADTSNTSTEALVAGGNYAIQCNGSAYYRASVDGTAAVTNDVQVEMSKLFDIPLFGDEKRLSVLAASGTVACKVYKVKKKRN